MSKSSLIFLIVVFFVVFVGFIYASSFTDTAQVDFNNGTYVNTSFNGTGVVLNGSNTSDVLSDIWRSYDYGGNWTLIKDDYNGGDANGGNDLERNSTHLFVLFNQDLWISPDNGLNWTKINDDYND